MTTAVRSSSSGSSASSKTRSPSACSPSGNCGGHEIVNAVPSTRNFRRIARSLGIRLAAEYTVRLPMNNLDYEHIPVHIETYALMGKATVKSLSGFAHEPESSSLTFRELIPLTDKSITVDESCTGCGTCTKVCPVGNIALEGGRPQWLHRCEMCFACDEFCPRGAIHH